MRYYSTYHQAKTRFDKFRTQPAPAKAGTVIDANGTPFRLARPLTKQVEPPASPPKAADKPKPAARPQKPPAIGEEKIVKSRGKEVKLVDKDAVRPTVDNADSAKLALKQRYPDIEFEASMTGSVAGPDGKVTPTVGKDDIFNLTYKPKTTAKEPTPGTVAEVVLTKLPKQKGGALTGERGEYLVNIVRNDVNQLTGKPSLVPDLDKDYKTLRGALNAFKKHVGNEAKVPTLDEIKMGPKRGAEKIQELTEDLVKAVKALGDCNGGKSVQSEVSGPNAAGAGIPGKGTPGTN